MSIDSHGNIHKPRGVPGTGQFDGRVLQDAPDVDLSRDYLAAEATLIDSDYEAISDIADRVIRRNYAQDDDTRDPVELLDSAFADDAIDGDGVQAMVNGGVEEGYLAGRQAMYERAIAAARGLWDTDDTAASAAETNPEYLRAQIELLTDIAPPLPGEDTDAKRERIARELWA